MSGVIRVSRIEKPKAIQLTKTNAKEVAAFIKSADNVDISSVRAGGGWVKVNRGFGNVTITAGTWAIIEHNELFFLSNWDFRAQFRKLK